MHITLSLQLIYESKIKFLLKNSLNKTHALTGAPEAHVPRSHQSMLGPIVTTANKYMMEG